MNDDFPQNALFIQSTDFYKKNRDILYEENHENIVPESDEMLLIFFCDGLLHIVMYLCTLLKKRFIKNDT